MSGSHSPAHRLCISTQGQSEEISGVKGHGPSSRTAHGGGV